MPISLRKVEPFSADALAKLDSSGLSEAQARALGMYSVADASKLHDSFHAAPALVLPYFSVDKKPLKTHPSYDEFYRIRYLGKTPSFLDVVDGKAQRYTQPPGSGVCAYFPLSMEWPAYVSDTGHPLLITEGELKAAKACAEGFPTIGLGGVFNFRAMARGQFLIPELSAIDWRRRVVTIAYDSDYPEKPMVCRAINMLAEELQERGALVNLITLPDVYEEPDKKTGLDDFLVERGDEALVRRLEVAEPLFMAEKLWQMNDEIVYIKTPGIVVEQSSTEKMNPGAFIAHSTYATNITPVVKVKPDGKISYVKANAADVWIHWPHRRSAARITYAPGQPRFIDEGNEERFNEWKGWGCEPKKGDVTPWTELLKFIFADADPAFVQWFLDWCAYPLQYPGAKLFSAVVIHGRATGTGKTLIGYTLGKIYGENFTKIENKHLKRDFNGWAVKRQFVLGDEISGSDKRSEADAMKTVITQEEISINVKMLPEYTIPDCINYYFTSNHADAFFIEDKDRRYAIHEVKHREPLPDAFYKEYEKWKEGDGPSALFHHLLQRDLSKFNPKAAAFMTDAKKRMMQHGKGDLAAWCAELAEKPENKLWLGQMRYTRDLFTSQELLNLYRQENDQGLKVTANGMGRAMAGAGFSLVYKGTPVPWEDKQARYWIVRSAERWEKKVTLREIISNLKLQLARTA